jgi:P-type E1-E2 ATPase
MISLKIPGVGTVELEKAVFDLNGTIAVDGVISDAVKEKLKELSEKLQVYVLTADTHGTAEKAVSGLAIEIVRISSVDEAQKKRDFVCRPGKKKTVAIGNGANDVLMLQESRIGIAVIGKEGAYGDVILSADVIVHSGEDALDLLLNPMRLVSTLRR